MKTKNYCLQRLKSFCILSGVYYRRLERGMSISNLVSQLDTEECIYKFNKDINDEELKSHTGFIEKDEDIEENYYALAKAVYDFTKEEQTSNKIVNEYILKMKLR